MLVGLLKIEQKELIKGKEFMPNCFFNPIQDKNGNFVISIQEIEQAHEEFDWVKELPLIDFEPIITDLK